MSMVGPMSRVECVPRRSKAWCWVSAVPSIARGVRSRGDGDKAETLGGIFFRQRSHDLGVHKLRNITAHSRDFPHQGRRNKRAIF